jgi:hypothetical protein
VKKLLEKLLSFLNQKQRLKKFKFYVCLISLFYSFITLISVFSFDFVLRSFILHIKDQKFIAFIDVIYKWSMNILSLSLSFCYWKNIKNFHFMCVCFLLYKKIIILYAYLKNFCKSSNNCSCDLYYDSWIWKLEGIVFCITQYRYSSNNFLFFLSISWLRDDIIN